MVGIYSRYADKILKYIRDYTSDLHKEIEELEVNLEECNQNFQKLDDVRKSLNVFNSLLKLDNDEKDKRIQELEKELNEKQLQTLWVRILPTFSEMALDGIEETKVDFLRRINVILQDIKERGNI